MTNYRPIDWLEWLPKELYRVGDDGVIWKYWRGSRWKPLKPSMHNGRFVVMLADGKTCHQYGVAALVLTAFVGIRSNEFEPYHFPNKDRRDCSLSNLRWAPKGANRAGVRAGIAPQGRGEDAPTAKLKDRDVLQMRKMARKGVMLIEIAERYGVHGTTVAAAIRGRTWKHLPGFVAKELRGGGNHPRAVVTEREVKQIRQLAREGMRPVDIAKTYRVTPNAVAHILHGRCWKDVGDVLTPEEVKTVAKSRRLGRAKLRETDVRVIRGRLEAGDTYACLATRFGVSRSLISMIARGEVWIHVSDPAQR